MQSGLSTLLRVEVSRRATQTTAAIVFGLTVILQTTIIRVQAVPDPPLSLTTAGFLVGFLTGVLVMTLTAISLLTMRARRSTSAA